MGRCGAKEKTADIVTDYILETFGDKEFSTYDIKDLDMRKRFVKNCCFSYNLPNAVSNRFTIKSKNNRKRFQLKI